MATEICPWCKKDFEVKEYGYNLKCPLCKKRINVFPDSNFWINTKWGTFGLSSSISSILNKLMGIK